MHKQDAIGTLTTFSIIILGVGLMNHVMVIPPLLQEAKRDAWASVLATIVPYLIWTIAVYLIMKRTDQQPLLPWLRQRIGRVASGPFRVFFIAYLFLIGVMTLKDTAMWTHSSYLPRTPTVVLSLSLVMLCGFAANAGIGAIAITSGILLPFVVIFGDFVMSANLPAKNYSLLTPLLENGVTPLLKGSLYVGGGLVELIVILLMQQHFKARIRLWSLWLLALFLVILVFGPVTGAIAEFGPFEAAELRYPAFEEWRLVKIGKYIRHVDFLSIYQWLSGAFVRIAIALLLLLDLLAPDNRKIRTAWLVFLGILLVVLVELPISDMQYLTWLKNIYLPGSFWAVTGVLLILLVLVLVSNKSRMGKHET